MPFIVDDIFFRMFGLSIPPFDMIWLFEQISDYAYQEIYDPETIGDQIKENRLLYEFGEITKEEYERNDEELNRKLKIANQINNPHFSIRMDLLGK